MPRNKKRREVPPRRNDDRKTPRILARCLKVLRRRIPNTDRDEMAERLGVAEATIRKWENPKDNQAMTYAYLERYQDWYGIPVGVLLMISHMAAAVRDDRKGELETMARMLRVLADRVLEPGNQIELLNVPARVKPADQSYDDWDLVLNDLIDSLRRALPRQQRVLKNHQRLDRHRKRRERR